MQNVMLRCENYADRTNKKYLSYKRKTGGPLSLFKVKKRTFSQIKSEKYWSLIANEMDLFFIFLDMRKDCKWFRKVYNIWHIILSFKQGIALNWNGINLVGPKIQISPCIGRCCILTWLILNTLVCMYMYASFRDLKVILQKNELLWTIYRIHFNELLHICSTWHVIETVHVLWTWGPKWYRQNISLVFMFTTCNKNDLKKVFPQFISLRNAPKMVQRRCACLNCSARHKERFK